MKIIIALISLFIISCSPKHEQSNSELDNKIKNGLSEDELVTFNEIIKPLFINKCSSCHSESSNLINVLDYEISKNNIEKIITTVVDDKSMPLAGSMTDEERLVVEKWLDDGLLKMKEIDSNKPSPEEKVSFSKDISPLFQAKCSACHNESSQLIKVLDYQVAKNSIDKIFKAVVTDMTMPLGGSTTSEERELIELWMEDGLLE